MVDLEAHIAPGFDDGAPDRATALEMCRIAAANGTRELVVAVSSDLSTPFDRDGLDAAAAELQAAVGDGLYLHTACVVRLSWHNAARVLAQPEAYTLNRLRYLPLEFSREMLARGGVGRVLRRYRDSDLSPVVVNPERRSSLRRDPSRLRNWAMRGCSMQVAAGSLTGLYGEAAQTAAIELIDAGLVQFVASSARSAGQRSPRLNTAFEFVVYRWGRRTAERLFLDNPWLALWGEPLPTIGRVAKSRHSLLGALAPRGRSRRVR